MTVLVDFLVVVGGLVVALTPDPSAGTPYCARLVTLERVNNPRWYLKLCILAIVRLDDFRTSFFRFSGLKVADWRKQEERGKGKVLGV